jgi:hypothetical protein
MTVTKKPTPFQIIKHRGTPDRAQLPDGTWVRRLPWITIPETGRKIPCAPYDDHFVFEIPSSVAHLYPGSAYKCTCGSAAGWVGPSGYVLDASQQGLLFVCLAHAQNGVHATGGTRWV